MRVIQSFLIATSFSMAVTLGFTEEERLVEYHARNYTWPIDRFVPDTPGWNKLMQHRLRQVDEMTSDRFEGFAQTLSAGLVQPNFTEHGFGLARAPEELMEALRQGIRDGLAAGPSEEYYIPAITGLRPWFIKRPDLTKRVLDELQYYPETWAGMELTPFVAYGFRLYRNESSLYMHIDRPETHVISFILHIDSSEDAEPWPLIIEDLQGNTHEVLLTSGDICFYESSKVFHGRPTKLKGSWYSSVFVHYYPKYGYKETFDRKETAYAIPPHWNEKPDTNFETPLEMHGTALDEPTCPNGWCSTKTAKKWFGPAEEGYWTAPTGEKFPFFPKTPNCLDKDSECTNYLRRNSDECKKNPKYMLDMCPKSCNVCTPDDRDEL